jgi:methyl-accepting chemotaxis protein
MGEAATVLAQGVTATEATVQTVAHSADLMAEARNNAAETVAGAGAVASAIGEIAQMLQASADAMSTLGRQSQQISDLSQVVKGIAGRVNLLALNAAIEAARAGEHGRGFAVVAQEVRKLAENSTRQAQEIETVVRQVVGQLGNAGSDIGAGVRRANDLIAETDAATRSVTDIERLVAEIVTPFQAVSGSMQSHADMLTGVSTSVTQMAAETQQMTEPVDLVARESSQLLRHLHDAQSSIGSFCTGSFTDQVRRNCVELAREVGAVFDAAVAGGKVRLEDVVGLSYSEIKGAQVQALSRLFDVSRVPLSGFNPPKYTAAYDQAVEGELQAVLDRYLGMLPDLLYTSVIDLNGYAPISNRITCRDWTGDFRADALNNRVKRLTTDLAQLEAAQVGLKVPAQTSLSVGPYVRDMRTVYTREEFKRFGNPLLQADEPEGIVSCHTLAGL